MEGCFTRQSIWKVYIIRRGRLGRREHMRVEQVVFVINKQRRGKLHQKKEMSPVKKEKNIVHMARKIMA